MECADDDLSQILPERPLHPSEVSDLLPPVLDALFYLHKKSDGLGCGTTFTLELPVAPPPDRPPQPVADPDTPTVK